MGLIRARRASGEDRGDVLSALIAARDDDGSGMSDQQIYDELITLFIAGHETTSMLLTWTLYLLAQHTEIQDKLRAEVRKVLATNQMPGQDTLDEVSYIEQVLRESMRLYPPAWSLVAREALEDLHFGEYVIPKGHILVISPWVLHHDAKSFPDPWTFDPDRFAQGWKQRIPAYAYIPFGAGQRVCSGQHLAMFEAEVLLATMIERYTFALVSDEAVLPEPLITIRPKGGLHLQIRRR
jgi:cytochrome P450